MLTIDGWTTTMRDIRRKEKAITEHSEMVQILKTAKYVTIAMIDGDQPYLVTLSHGYDEDKNCIYFHCAKDGKKVDILSVNNKVWGQAIDDYGYQQGSCDHLYATTQFSGRVTFLEDIEDKRHALIVMITGLEDDPKKVIEPQITEKSLKGVGIGRIDIDFMSGKKSKEVIISI
ncbi:MAG: pyridoxamine 5'-phosphate oxidase family protein [Candidatus Thorarchaeota archaeon]